VARARELLLLLLRVHPPRTVRQAQIAFGSSAARWMRDARHAGRTARVRTGIVTHTVHARA
jgi:hypothetical protein